MHPAAGMEERQAAGNMAALLSKRSADKDIDPPGHPIKGCKGCPKQVSVRVGKRTETGKELEIPSVFSEVKYGEKKLKKI